MCRACSSSRVSVSCCVRSYLIRVRIRNAADETSTAVIEAKIRKGEKPVANLIVTQFVLPGRDPRAERPAPGDYPPGD